MITTTIKFLNVVLEQLRDANRERKRMANEIENLNANVVALTAAVDKVVAVLAEPKIDPVAVQAAADAVAAQTARLTIP
jgi:single-stranded DNA-specific DHH superfamily exonuclease